MTDWCENCTIPMSILDPGKRRIIAAGKAISSITSNQAERDAAISIVSDWRARHTVPMGIVATDLRFKCSQVDSRAFTAQRLKRLESIIAKLGRRDDLPSMNIWTMQDIGGCRAVLPTVAGVLSVDELYRAGLFLPHRRKDYIAQPKQSGYRGIHLVMKYQGMQPSEYDGMQIEIQLRSRLQHIWATAIETVGYFSRQSLKSSVGSEMWLRLFSLVGSLIALKEKCPPVPGTPETIAEIVAELRPLTLEARPHIMAYAETVKHAEAFRSHPDSEYYLLTISQTENEIVWRTKGYRRERLGEANSDYLRAETEGLNAVLVSTESLAALWEAYPNYRLAARV